MKRILFLSFIPLTLLLLSFTGEEKCRVNYDGIYTASVDAETDAHIRFYDNGTVIVSTSVKNIKDVNKWFTKENIDQVLKGDYKIKGCTLKFKAKGYTGEQIFSGTISGSDLLLTIKDAKTKASTTRTYHFIAL